MKTHNIVPYKNRKIDTQAEVDVYRCLPRKGKIYSLRQNGLVVGHATAITLKDCKFVIHKAGQLRARKTKTRNVHAHIRGFLDLKAQYNYNALNDDKLPLQVEYQPFKYDEFTVVKMHGENTTRIIQYADEVLVNVNGVTAYQQIAN
jgi:hypothetical protein